MTGFYERVRLLKKKQLLRMYGEMEDEEERQNEREVVERRPPNNRSDRSKRGIVSRPMRITIPEGDSLRRRIRDDEEENVDHIDPRGKRPTALGMKNKKTKQMVGTKEEGT